MTRWGRTIHQVIQGKSGGGTCCGSCWMSLSVMHSFWNVSPSMPYLPELDGPCSSSSLNWLSNSLEAFVAGSNTLERRGSVSPKPMQLLCTTYLVIKKWSFRAKKKACIHCSNHGWKTPCGRTPETTYGCNRCGVNLCRNSCFLQYHTENKMYATLISKI